MSPLRLALILASLVGFATASQAFAAAPRHKIVHGYIRGLPPASRGVPGRSVHRGMVDLAGNAQSGYGFYPLPYQVRLGAWRYRQRLAHAPWQNGVLFAMAADAARYGYSIPGSTPYRSGVYNPIDGVGTPFFGGYYSAGEDDPMPRP